MEQLVAERCRCDLSPSVSRPSCFTYVNKEKSVIFTLSIESSLIDISGAIFEFVVPSFLRRVQDFNICREYCMPSFYKDSEFA